MKRLCLHITALMVVIAGCTAKKTTTTSGDGLNFEWPDKVIPNLPTKAIEYNAEIANEPPPVIVTSEEVRSTDLKAEAITKFTLDWQGTPHRIGGMSREGVDCSGFTVLMFETLFNHRFTARRSADLYTEVEPVKRSDLIAGDLVFFKIYGRRIDHVGVYVGNGLFAHASVRNGVIFSKLSEPYYDRRFFMGGRIKNQTLKLN